MRTLIRIAGAGLGLVGLALIASTLGVSSVGCVDCADYDEYCVELDCCEELTCVYDEIAGYRCR